MDASLDVRIRPHVLLGAGVIGAAVLSAPAISFLHAPLPGHVPLLLALVGMTMLLSGVALWYLPSFAKRAVTPAPVARALPYVGGLFLAALVGNVGASLRDGREAGYAATLILASILAALLLAGLAAVLVVSVLAGPPWRGGVPFWRKPGEFQAGDRAALVAFAASVSWLLATATLLALRPADPFGPGTYLSWLTALLLLVFGSLGHFVPRGRGSPLHAHLLLAGVVVLSVGALLLVLPRPPTHAPAVFSAGLLLAAVSLGLEGRGRGKPPGPRQREARPLLFAAWLVLVGACLAFAASPWRGDLLFLAHAGLAMALFLGAAALSLLALPVVFNQRPNGALVLPSAVAALSGYAVLLAATFARPDLGRWAILGFSISILLWLGALWPLRSPRRECVAD